MITVPTDLPKEGESRLYQGHEPITFLQRSLLAAGSAFMGLIEPTRSGKKII